MTTQSHHDHVEKQFSSQASEYLTSTVHKKYRRPFFACARHQLFPEIG
ncbi:methyltransferase, UbiE/COQ5 family, partial [Escherichia coli 99.1753]